MPCLVACVLLALPKLSSTFFCLITGSIGSENGNQTKTWPDLVRREENPQPHSICNGRAAGSSNRGEDSRNGRPQFTKVQIWLLRSKHIECNRPQLEFPCRKSWQHIHFAYLMLVTGAGSCNLKGGLACFPLSEKSSWLDAKEDPLRVPRRVVPTVQPVK